MGDVLLTIGIPTRNRAGYLRDLLTSLETQIREDRVARDDLEVIVSDNASQDETASLAQDFARRDPHFQYTPNAENIGAQGNYHKLVRLAAGRYVWIIGDDDLLLPGALAHTISQLKHDPDLSLIIHFDTRYDPRLRRPQRFASYRDYLQECARVHPHALIEHTLTTSNVYRATAFDRAFAQANDGTDFPHMYGMGLGLRKTGGAVYVSAHPSIRVRDQRAPAVDGLWPADLERSWLAYLGWMRDLYQVPELRPASAIDHIRRELLRKITRHPLRYIRDNLPALRQPKAYWWFLKRVLFHSRKK